MKDDKQILLVAQKNAAQDDPSADDILPGRHRLDDPAAAEAARRHREGAGRGRPPRADRPGSRRPKPISRRSSTPMPDQAGDKKDLEALGRTVVAQFEQYIKLNKKIAPEVLVSLNQIEEPSKLADTVASHLKLKIAEKQELLEIATRQRAAGARVRPHGVRDRRAAGREEDPQPREAADGEDPARVLSERAAEGDPEGAGRGRGRQGRDRRARSARSRRPSCPRKPATRRWRS